MAESELGNWRAMASKVVVVQSWREQGLSIRDTFLGFKGLEGDDVLHPRSLRSPCSPLRGLPHYGNWGSVIWTVVPATFQSKCLHLITLSMVMYHTIGSLAPHRELKFLNFQGKTNGGSS